MTDAYIIFAVVVAVIIAWAATVTWGAWRDEEKTEPPEDQ